MPTDDERREVARRLRELRLDPWDDAACEIAQCAGIVCCNSECHGSNETPECTMALASQLADLIEPTCDRDALLELAEEMRGYADGAASGDGFPYVNAGSLWSYADRIREALGVEK